MLRGRVVTRPGEHVGALVGALVGVEVGAEVDGATSVGGAEEEGAEDSSSQKTG